MIGKNGVKINLPQGSIYMQRFIFTSEHRRSYDIIVQEFFFTYYKSAPSSSYQIS